MLLESGPGGRGCAELEQLVTASLSPAFDVMEDVGGNIIASRVSGGAAIATITGANAMKAATFARCKN